MDSSIYGLVQSLAKCHVRSSTAPFKGHFDSGRLTRKFIKIIYEALLSYHSSDCSRDIEKNWTTIDRLYAICFKKSFLGNSHESERLYELTDHLRSSLLNLNAQIPELLVFLLSLAKDEDDDDDDETDRLGTGLNLLPAVCSEAAGGHHYTCLPGHVFEKVGIDFTRERYGSELLNPKLFSMKPGLLSATSQLKCNLASFPWLKDRPLSNTLSGTLAQPSMDPWKLDSKLEIPELTDEPEASLPSFHNGFSWKRGQFAIADAITGTFGKGDHLTADEDEGFIETDSPTSSNSSGHIVDRATIWDLALTEDYFKNPSKRFRTWESLGYLEPIVEKPYFTDAGPEAVDHLVISLQTELSITCPNEVTQTLLNVRQCEPLEIIQSALYVLVGISSRIFSYEEKSCSFSVSPVSTSGLSPQALLAFLEKFAASGTDHVRLERLIASDKSCGLVFQAFAKGVRRYLFHRQVVIAFLTGQQTGPSKAATKHPRLCLLHLLDKTDRLRYQTRFLAELCGLTSGIMAALPAGVGLLQHLYEVAAHCSCNPDAFPVALSLLHHASLPYFLFLKKWAFEGIYEDRYDEFPIAISDGWIGSSVDEGFWDHSFVLRVKSDPILTSLLPKVLVCGKSIDLLRRCCPNNHLCHSKRNFPLLTLVFSEADMRRMMMDHQRYADEVESDAQQLRLFKTLEDDSKHKRKSTNVVQKDSHSSTELREREASTPIRADSTNGSPTASSDEPLVSIGSDSETSEKRFVSPEDTPSVNVLQDANANPVESLVPCDFHVCNSECPLPLGDTNQNTIVNPTIDNATVETSVGPAKKGTKRKQDRDSIDFEVLSARRPFKRDGFGATLAASGTPILVEGSTFQVLRSRGRSSHGHVSDSTIQKLLYGSTYLKPKQIPETNHVSVATSVVDADSKSLDELVAKVFGSVTVPPYEVDLTRPTAPTLINVSNYSATSRKSPDEKTAFVQCDVSFWKNQSLPVLFNNCILKPLTIQISLVDRALLDYFFDNLKLRSHFGFLYNHFFMQDGEFSQCLCDGLFERLNGSASPSDLLNPLVLNSILSKALSYSSFSALVHSSGADAPCDMESNLSFVIKFLPQSFQLNSPNVLDCLGLSYRVDFPANIVLSSKSSKYYERVFGFLLQLRRCLWASTDLYHILKKQDPAATSAAAHSTMTVKQYRLLHLYRHEMHHFLRCLQEHLFLQAFQATHLKFERDLCTVQCLDELVELHVKYLQKVFFRCLLHKKAAPVMTIVRKIFAIVLKFHSQLLTLMSEERNGSSATAHYMQKFAQIQASYKIFKDYSTYLFEVITKLVSRGYQRSLQKFLTRLDCNDWYSSAMQRTEDAPL